MANWDFDTEEDVVEAFKDRARERLAHGYELREGDLSRLPEQDPSSGL
jgi:hypothetical protein